LACLATGWQPVLPGGWRRRVGLSIGHIDDRFCKDCRLGPLGMAKDDISAFCKVQSSVVHKRALREFLMIPATSLAAWNVQQNCPVEIGAI